MIEVKHVSWATLYQGTMDELVNAGLAVSGMFRGDGVSMSSKRCASYHPEQGKWRLIKNYKLDGAHVYRLYYEHNFDVNNLDEFDRQTITMMRAAMNQR